jgi:hypothetical protein
VRREHGRSALRPTNNEVAGPKICRFQSLFSLHFAFFSFFLRFNAAAGVYEMASKARGRGQSEQTRAKACSFHCGAWEIG